MNTIKCGNCAHFDEQFKPEARKKSDGTKVNVSRSLWYGWCAAKSIYPAVEQDGQVFPLDVKRRSVEEQRNAEPVIVDKNKVIPHCTHVMEKAVVSPLVPSTAQRRRV